MKVGRWLKIFFLLAAMLGLLPLQAIAAPPVVKTVPWVASNPLIPHDTYSGKIITLKGTSDSQGANFQYTWDFGDGSAVAIGTVANRYAIEAKHAYTGATGQVFTARLTILNTTTAETASKEYFVKMQDKTLAVEANIAIDEGLWFLHKGQTKSADMGYWSTNGYYSETPANVTAFEVNGHLETGNNSNPYVETVSRGLKYIFTLLAQTGVLPNQTNPRGSFNPDTNSNSVGIAVNQVDPFYQGGMFMDAIIASGTPNTVATTGPAGVLGKTYKTIVADMADYYNYCQYDFGSNAGGWRYSCNEGPDNSANQWAAIGYIPAQRSWGVTVPQPVKDANLLNWLAYSQNGNGSFGYTGADGGAWGLQATTPSGMVQLVWNGKGRGYAQWDKAETYMRNNFCNTGGPTVAVRDYYYGLFSFVKSMLLHDSNGDGIAEPIQFLAQQPGNSSPIDWYFAEASKGAQCDGVARTLINDQAASGQWSGNNYYFLQTPYETAQAIIMLNRTIYEAGAPVAVASATPSPALAGQLITLSGAGSFHQDPSKSIVKWEWDLDNDGAFDDAVGVVTTTSWPVLGTYPVRLRVTDNAATPSTAETIVTVQVTVPPIAPTANAGGSYTFCMGKTPWYLDGSGSKNPDDGQSQPGNPVDFIKSYAWELDGNSSFNDAFGAKPDVTVFFTGKGAGSYLVQLRVTDNTATSFPGAGLPDLADTDSAQVVVKASTDPACVACVKNLAARPKAGKVQLTWTKTAADHYNVYRSTVDGGPYVLLATTTSIYATYLDQSVVNGTTYYYIVREAALNGSEYCQSNQAKAKPVLLP